MFFGKMKEQSDAERIPPNQRVTSGWPVLHYGNVPTYREDLSDWDLKVFGLVEEPMIFSFDDILSFPQKKIGNDIHCVTGWSKLDNVWSGVSTTDVAEQVGVKPEANYVLLHAEEGWSTNLPIKDFLAETSMLAHSHNGESLTPEHGYPLRVVVPHLYFWKSAKWLRAIEFRETDAPGFWERNGYHMYGDPWRQQRFSWD